jgi:hypothetical protein
MRHRVLSSLGALTVGVTVLTPPLAGQAPTAKKIEQWTPPRTLDGQPDLEGIWNYASGTPLERPAAFAGKAVLTDDELNRAEKQAHELGNGDRRDGAGTDADVNRDANEFWFERRATILTKRTSLIIDPPDGKLPAVTEEASRRRTAREGYLREHPADSWEDRRLNERCLMYLQSGPPIIPAPTEFLLGFPFHFQIVQTPDYVAIRHEELSLRIIPLDGRSHVPERISQWLGDSRGHWDGETLVVETTNFRDKRPYNAAGMFTTQQMRLVERFTRVDADTMDYQFTIDDPTTWTKPWTAAVPIVMSKGKLFEFACHEGNYALPNVLSGARAQEKAAAETAKKGVH